MKLIGLAGPIAAGKTEAAKILSSFGYTRISLGDLLREIFDILEVEKTRDKLRDLGIFLRSTYGMDIMVKLAIFRAKNKGIEKLVIDGLRAREEAEEIKRNGGIVLYIDAPLRQRYERAIKRAREDERNISFERFAEEDKKDFEMGIKDVKPIADRYIDNSGSIEELKEKIKEVIEKYNL